MTIIKFLKTIEMARATAPLATYVRKATREPLVITQKGQPVAVLVPVQGIDLESLSVSTDPNFLNLLERSRASYEAEGGISDEEMRRRLGIKPAKAKRKR